MNYATRCALDELAIEEETAQRYEAEEVAQKVEAIRRELRANTVERDPLNPEDFRSLFKFFEAVEERDAYVEHLTRLQCEKRGIEYLTRLQCKQRGIRYPLA